MAHEIAELIALFRSGKVDFIIVHFILLVFVVAIFSGLASVVKAMTRRPLTQTQIEEIVRATLSTLSKEYRKG